MRTLADWSRSILPRPRPSVALAVSWVTTPMPNCQVNFTASWTPVRIAAIITWTAASREMSRAVQTASMVPTAAAAAPSATASEMPKVTKVRPMPMAVEAAMAVMAMSHWCWASSIW
jgi:hypothetical protein